MNSEELTMASVELNSFSDPEEGELGGKDDTATEAELPAPEGGRRLSERSIAE